jgi:plasmid stability protein
MPQLLVRDLSEETINRLKKKAKYHGRSLQGEIKCILEEASLKSMEDAKALAQKIQSSFRGKRFSNSSELIRQDRDR